MLHTTKAIFSGGLFVAYLIFGSGSFVEAPLTDQSAKKEMESFLATIPRAVYPYSVVRGGAYTTKELEAARRSDPVVAAHFADFGHHLEMVRLKRDMYVYVSYRKGNMVFWTKTRHKVCKGELMISDGENLARARCANRISRIFKPPMYQAPVVPEYKMDVPEPPSPPEALPDPYPTQLAVPQPYVEVAQTGAGGQPVYTPPIPSYFPSFLPFAAAAPAAFLTPNNPVPPPPPTSTPEPESLVLVGLGLIGLAGVRTLRRFVANRNLISPSGKLRSQI